MAASLDGTTLTATPSPTTGSLLLVASVHVAFNFGLGSTDGPLHNEGSAEITPTSLIRRLGSPA